MDALEAQSRKKRLLRISVLGGVGLAGILLVIAWMKGWLGGESAAGTSDGKELVYELGNGVKLTLCWCPAGTFLMGSPAAETERQANERQHEVTLTQGFWMAKTETTQAQWEAVMSGNPSQFKGSRLPVDSVTWDEAKAFAQRCTERLWLEGKLPPGWEFQLPSEAQWEYACPFFLTRPSS